MFDEHSASMSEAYGDELLGGVDLVGHGGGDGALRGRIPTHMHALFILLGALALLWFIGGVLFKGVNI